VEGRRWGQSEKNHAFSQPLKTSRKSLSGNSKDGNDNDGFLFGNLMSYMMYQNRVENMQSYRQNRIGTECREREYELCCKELAVQHKENRAQHHLMNVMVMAIINKNNESNNNSTPNHNPMNNECVVDD
jgi:hypothetical protein